MGSFYDDKDKVCRTHNEKRNALWKTSVVIYSKETDRYKALIAGIAFVELTPREEVLRHCNKLFQNEGKITHAHTHARTHTEQTKSLLPFHRLINQRINWTF